jgi:hypothetical protein
MGMTTADPQPPGIQNPIAPGDEVHDAPEPAVNELEEEFEEARLQREKRDDDLNP